MELHIIAPASGISFSDADHSAAVRRRRRSFLIIVGLSALTWVLIGTVVVALA